MKNTLTATSMILLFLLSLTAPVATTLTDGSTSNQAGRSTACSGYVCLNEVIPNPNGFDDANYLATEVGKCAHMFGLAVCIVEFLINLCSWLGWSGATVCLQLSLV